MDAEGSAAASSASWTPLALVDMLAANPCVSTKGAAEQLGVAFTTAQRAIRRLESLSIVRENQPGQT